MEIQGSHDNFKKRSEKTNTMGDIGTDYEASIDLILQSYRRLQERTPGHELLTLITPEDDKGFWAGTSFDERYQLETDRHRIQPLNRYLVALMNAVEGKPYHHTAEEAEAERVRQMEHFFEGDDDDSEDTIEDIVDDEDIPF